MKTQFIRILDIIVIGPAMMWGGWKLRKGSPVLGWSLMGMGAGTVVYNAKNYHDVDVARIAAGAQLMADPSIVTDTPYLGATEPIRPELRDFGITSVGDNAPREVHRESYTAASEAGSKKSPFQAIGEQPTPRGVLLSPAFN